jgi:hypothetical protein
MDFKALISSNQLAYNGEQVRGIDSNVLLITKPERAGLVIARQDTLNPPFAVCTWYSRAKRYVLEAIILYPNLKFLLSRIGL